MTLEQIGIQLLVLMASDPDHDWSDKELSASTGLTPKQITLGLQWLIDEGYINQTQKAVYQ